MTLYNAQNQPIAEGAPQVAAASSSATVKDIQIEDLPAGWYALGFDGGTFPPFFSIDVEGVKAHTLLPLIKP